jgi:hypothetical protein
MPKRNIGGLYKRFSQRKVSLVDVHIHANGNLAWEMAVETGQALLNYLGAPFSSPHAEPVFLNDNEWSRFFAVARRYHTL